MITENGERTTQTRRLVGLGSLTVVVRCQSWLQQILFTSLTATFNVSEHLVLAGSISWSTLESVRIRTPSCRFSRPSSESETRTLNVEIKSKTAKEQSKKKNLHLCFLCCVSFMRHENTHRLSGKCHSEGLIWILREHFQESRTCFCLFIVRKKQLYFSSPGSSWTLLWNCRM